MPPQKKTPRFTMRPKRQTPCVGSPVTAWMPVPAIVPWHTLHALDIYWAPPCNDRLFHIMAFCLNLAGASGLDTPFWHCNFVSHGTLPRPSQRINIGHFGITRVFAASLCRSAGAFVTPTT